MELRICYFQTSLRNRRVLQWCIRIGTLAQNIIPSTERPVPKLASSMYTHIVNNLHSNLILIRDNIQFEVIDRTQSKFKSVGLRKLCRTIPRVHDVSFSENNVERYKSEWAESSRLLGSTARLYLAHSCKYDVLQSTQFNGTVFTIKYRADLWLDTRVQSEAMSNSVSWPN